MTTTPCPKHMRSGRLAKAEQFLSAALDVEALADEGSDVGDAFVTLCVHAGIAAADVLCCAALGEHATGPSHQSAVELLRRVSTDAPRHLKTLLDMKTKAGYAAVAVTGAEIQRATRAAQALVESARRAHATAG